jgi:hypothetical protein
MYINNCERGYQTKEPIEEAKEPIKRGYQTKRAHERGQRAQYRMVKLRNHQPKKKRKTEQPVRI